MPNAPIETPGGITPQTAMTFDDSTGHAQGVSAATPLPIAGPEAVPATSTPLSGTISDTTAHVLGPFAPQIGRTLWATLVGTGASGSIQLLRSTDGGTTKLPITVGSGLPGSAIGQTRYVWSFTAYTGTACNEDLFEATDSATYYLAITLTAGSLTYRLGQ